MKLRTLIIDDEPLAHEIILQYVEEMESIVIIGQCYSALEALNFLRKEPVDLLFLDIKMPKLKGTDFLRILEKKPLVIVTSAFEEYALESFELDVCDYLLKPFRFDRFLKATNKAIDFFQLKNQSPKEDQGENSVAQDQKQELFLKVDKKLIQVNISEIFLLESFGNYVKVWVAEQFYLTPGTLSSFEKQLPVDFIRVHKSYIIHKPYIEYLEGNMVLLKNQQKIPVGKQHRSKIKQVLTKG